MKATYKVPVADSGSDTPISRNDALSQPALPTAVGLLQLGHGIVDRHGALEVMRDAARRLDVPLEALAAALISAPPSTWGRTWGNPLAIRPAKAGEPPRLSFASRAHEWRPNRSHVLRALLAAAMDRASTDRGTVQLLDPVYHRLTLEDHNGFDPAFVDFFSYVDDAGSACADALRNRRQTLVAEIGTSPVFTEPARAVVSTSGVRSVISTPLRDHRATVRGIVSVHYSWPHAHFGVAALAEIQHVADDCGRWLHWYDTAVIPAAVATVHTAAAQLGNGHRTPRYAPDTPPPIVSAGRVLMARYDLDAPTAAEVLVRLAARRGVSVGVLVAQLLD